MVMMKMTNGDVCVVENVENCNLVNDDLFEFVTGHMKVSLDNIEFVNMLNYEERPTISVLYRNARWISHSLAKRLLLSMVAVMDYSGETLDGLVTFITDDDMVEQTIGLIEELEESFTYFDHDKILEVFRILLIKEDYIDVRSMVKRNKNVGRRNK